ncbi:MAG: CPBP family intramembrane glutamic endopeptidase [candidate division Zixibacteria bacterium]
MPLSQDYSGQNKEKLKFHCSNCGIEIITKYLKPGDVLICKSCGKETVVPVSSLEINEELKKSKEPTQWGFGSVIKFTLAYILSIIPIIIIVVIPSMLIAKMFYPYVPVGEELYDIVNEDILFHSMDFIYYFVPIGLIYYSVVRRHKNRFFAALHIDKLSSGELLRWLEICITISIGLTLFSEFIEHVTPLGRFIPDEIPLYEIFKKGYYEVVWFSFFALIAPVQEELIFRGYVYQGIKNKFGTITSAIIVSVVFILLHGSQLAFNPILLFFIAIAAVLLIIVRIKTKSLTKCILLHLVFNTVSVIYLWIWIWLFGLESLWS